MSYLLSLAFCAVETPLGQNGLEFGICILNLSMLYYSYLDFIQYQKQKIMEQHKLQYQQTKELYGYFFRS